MKSKRYQVFQTMKSIYFVSLILGLITFACSKDIYVSPAGNNNNPGTKKLPLKTIQQAKQNAVQRIELGKEPEITVWLADGNYKVSGPVVFNAWKSASKNGVISFKAEKNANPVISGGVQILGWTKNEDGFWEAKLPDNMNGIKNFRELFIDGKRAVRARFPNDGYLRVKKAGTDRRTNFYFEQGDFPIPVNVINMELVFLHDWSITRIGVKEIDIQENKLTAVDTIGTTSLDFFRIDGWEPNPRYFLENAPEFIDVDYEWVFIPAERKILLKLPDNLNPANLQIVMPVSEGLIRLVGTEKNRIKNIHFEGITFQYSKWEIPDLGYSGVQACHYDPRPKSTGWSVVPAAVQAVWGENISFSQCTFKNFGGSGISIGTGCRNCTVLNSDLEDISGNGIMIGEGQDREVNGEKWWKSAPTQVALANTVENCRITDSGKQFYGAVGVWCGLTAETIIKNNEIFNLPYSGVSVGWMWSPEPTPCRQNTIEGNHIHHVMKILSDGGGIYMLGLQPGSIIRKNHIHDVTINAGRAESNGMFLDEGITDVIVENNLIYNIAKSPLRFHKATTNLVKNNYLFCDDDNPPIRYNSTQENDIQKVDNKVFNKGEINYGSELKKAIEKWK